VATRVAVGRETIGQLIRYGVNGGLVTGLYAIVYLLLDRLLGTHPQLANLGGYVVAVCVGYVLHSRVTFRDHGSRSRATQFRFAVASLLSYVVNVFWTWLCTEPLALPSWTPVLPIATLTPPLLFVVNRWWVFR
jgi:putative flippase GtrA